MNGFAMQRLVERMGPLGLLGMALLAAAVALWFALVAPEHERLNADARRSIQLQENIRQHVTGSRLQVAAGETPEAQLARFYGFFPGLRTLPDWLAKIDADARQEHLVLEQGDYRIVRDRLGLLNRYQVALPVHGSYPQVVNFVQRVLKDVPIAALESLSFERQQTADPQLEAKLRLTLFFGRDP